MRELNTRNAYRVNCNLLQDASKGGKQTRNLVSEGGRAVLLHQTIGWEQVFPCSHLPSTTRLQPWLTVGLDGVVWTGVRRRSDFSCRYTGYDSSHSQCGPSFWANSYKVTAAGPCQNNMLRLSRNYFMAEAVDFLCPDACRATSSFACARSRDFRASRFIVLCAKHRSPQQKGSML
jgi:hypothetical protein